jgi:F0F1-type ATP synthase assembly protein I
MTNKFISAAEITFWNIAIAVMSHENTPRVYSQTLATLTLRLQNFPQLKTSCNNQAKTRDRKQQTIRISIISAAGLVFGLFLGWLKSN